MRKFFLTLAGCALVSVLPVHAQSIKAIQIAGDFIIPTFLCSPPDDSSRLFVTTSSRGIWLIKDGFVEHELFLDMVGTLPQGQGLLGMTFDPDYAANGRFYIVYRDVSANSYVVEYHVSDDPDRADPTSARVLIGPVPQPDVIHNWNCLEFGPDGMLYVSVGDGGGLYDPDDDAQNLGSLFGKMLRIDPDLPPPHVPPDNPFVGVPGAREEVWAYGLRVPWRFCFDREAGDLYIADVGEHDREEINFQPASSPGGENYGWRCMEGTVCTGVAGCGCNDPGWIVPIHDYPPTAHRCAVIGGYVYRGAAIPGLQGTYFFGDFCAAGVWSFRYDGTTISEYQERTQELAPCGGVEIGGITSFGQDADGELYILTMPEGQVFKIVPADDTSTTYCTGAPNSAGPGARIGHEGSTQVSRSDFILTATGVVPGQTGFFYYGPNQSQTPFGHGLRCVSGQTFTFPSPLLVGSDGSASQRVDFHHPLAPEGAITAGSIWNFQFWYRDPAAGMPGFNLSDALHVEFCQ